jgi:VWFA-related protein
LRTVIDRHRPEQLPIGAMPPPPITRSASAVNALAPLRSPESISLAEQRFEITVDALSKVANRMKSLPGEKDLVWMTAGFPPPDDPRRFYEVSEQLRAARVRLYPIDARGFLACLPLPCPASVDLPIDVMEELARKTGGRAYHDSNGLSGFVRSALEDSRQGYLLTYSPNNYRRDGSPHKVELQTPRKGIQLRYRPGYTADSAGRN